MPADLHIRRDEVMRHLGHQGQAMDDGLAGRIEGVIARCEVEIRPRWLWRSFGVSHAATGTCEVQGTNLVLSGASMESYLAGASGIALMVCTLGPRADATLRTLGASDPLGQLVYDAACTDLIELAADAAEAEVVARALEQNLRTKARFSPGYGDLSLEVQPKLLDVLQAHKRLGVACNSELLLAPSKSITALVALCPDERMASDGTEMLGCDACNLRIGCQIRARGLRCHRSRGETRQG